MRDWIMAHTLEWPIFLAATTLLSFTVALAWARNRRRWILGLFLGVWCAGVLAIYIPLGYMRLLSYAPHLWSAQLATLALIMAVPLLLVLLTLALWMHRDPSRTWRSGAVSAAIVGALAMTLAPTISRWMLHLFNTWIVLDRRGR